MNYTLKMWITWNAGWVGAWLIAIIEPVWGQILVMVISIVIYGVMLFIPTYDAN